MTLKKMCAFKFLLFLIFSRPGQSQGLLCKHLWLIRWLSNPFFPQLYNAATPKRLEIALPVIVTKNCLNPKGHQNRIIGSKVTAILLNGWILPICEVASGRVCACILRSRLFFFKLISCTNTEILPKIWDHILETVFPEVFLFFSFAKLKNI